MKYIGQSNCYNPLPATIPDFYHFTNDLGLLYRHNTVSKYLNINAVNCVDKLNLAQLIYGLSSRYPILLSYQSTLIVSDYLQLIKAT
uniref:Uncharacterized protein n=1 Tax=Moorena producens (strain JHB) TaxID=1454205 RepID=A0A1D9FTZ9_MOOP1